MWRRSLAIQPKDNEAFYREVDEELRREQMSGFWRRYRVAIIAGIVLLLAVIAGVLWWQERSAARAAEQGEALTAAFEDVQASKPAEATAKLDQLVAEGTPGYRAAALLSKAAIAIEGNKEAEAIAAYGQVVGDEELPQAYRDLALIRQTALEFDTMTPAAVVERLKPLAVAGNPWFGSAGELTAAAHLKAGKPELAAPIFAAMAKDRSLPETIRSRAVQMAGALGVDAVEEPQTDQGQTKEVQQ